MPAETLRKALSELTKNTNIKIVANSRFWRTPAFPKGSGPDYVNAAVALSTGLSPQQLLAEMHRVEASFGRERKGPRWQARVIDLDLLAYGDLVLPDAATHDAWRALPPERQAEAAPEGLVLPHPRMQDRGFVLAPLAEVAPDWRHPRLGLTVAQMLSHLPPGALEGMEPATT
ncbi:2-amino-4-hydroxy-6-hydroxymethyldihydropteridine diphosphokinase [Paracoccus lutimaris]|uniref:2-amino-4-hydroxy-6-hydroxymethyldihydropteridine pyrophosphokinase n=2 Tax=Paracoccus lutimaris TaxID=1490030 RepID=A0A368YMA0_9RHOB|nr:2-amino-4-hydroxy-6-hydroxymethyldihydropteridine diphosphokinase [Paracoccus lutimaris]